MKLIKISNTCIYFSGRWNVLVRQYGVINSAILHILILFRYYLKQKLNVNDKDNSFIYFVLTENHN